MHKSQIKVGTTVAGPMFPEPVRVKSIIPMGDNLTMIEAVGINTERFFSPVLSDHQIDLSFSASP